MLISTRGRIISIYIRYRSTASRYPKSTIHFIKQTVRTCSAVPGCGGYQVLRGVAIIAFRITLYRNTFVERSVWFLVTSMYPGEGL